MNAPPAPSVEPVRLERHRPVSRTTIHGWAAVAFGSPFFATGLYILLASLGVIHIPPRSLHAPLWVVGICGLIFFLVGFSLIWHGLDGLRRASNMRREKQRRPDSPWLWDYPWQALGVSENKLKDALGALAALVGLTAFMAPFNWWAYVSGKGPPMVKFMVGGLDAIIALALGWQCYSRWASYLKFGNGRLRFDTFPFFLGESLAVTLTGLPQDFEKLEVTLRCVEEQYETHEFAHNRRYQQVACYELYRDTKVISGRLASGRERLPLSMKLPDNPGLSTSLSKRPARFWELEMKGEVPGVDFHRRFLVPVYSKEIDARKG